MRDEFITVDSIVKLKPGTRIGERYEKTLAKINIGSDSVWFFLYSYGSSMTEHIFFVRFEKGNVCISTNDISRRNIEDTIFTETICFDYSEQLMVFFANFGKGITVPKKWDKYCNTFIHFYDGQDYYIYKYSSRDYLFFRIMLALMEYKKGDYLFLDR